METRRVCFRVLGDALEPAAITAALGIAPSTAHRRHDPLPRRPDQHSATGARILDSPLPEEASLDAHVQWLLDRLEDKPALWSLVEKGYTVELYCSAWTAASHGTIALSHQTLARLGGVPFAVLIATYYLPEDNARDATTQDT